MRAWAKWGWYVAVAALSAGLAGCGSLEQVHHKPMGETLTVSIAEEGLSFWTELNTDSAAIVRQSMRVGGRDRTEFFQRKGLVEMGLDGHVVAARRMESAAMPLAPRAALALEREAAWMTPLRLQVSQSEAPDESADVQVVPGVLLWLLGDGIVRFESQLFTRYLDDKGERHVRVYSYWGRLDLPWVGTGNTWTVNNHVLLKRQIDSSFRALSKVMLRDVRGDFKAEASSPNPKALDTESAALGMITIKTYQLAQFDQLRVLYQVVGRNRSLRNLIVLDDAPAARIFGE